MKTKIIIILGILINLLTLSFAGFNNFGFNFNSYENFYNTGNVDFKGDFDFGGDFLESTEQKLETYMIKDLSGNEIGFYGNVGLNICLPFNFIGTGNYEKDKVKLSFNITCDNKCYIPLFGVNGGFNFGKNNVAGDMKFGIYYDCDVITKREVIIDYCNVIRDRVIKKIIEDKCEGGVFSPRFWMCQIGDNIQNIWDYMSLIWTQISPDDWKNMIPENPFDDMFTKKKYISIFKSPWNNKEFYDTYCKDNDYDKIIKICFDNKTMTIKYYDLGEYIKKGAYVGECIIKQVEDDDENDDENSTLPSTGENNDVEIDYNSNEIRMEFSKKYKIFR